MRLINFIKGMAFGVANIIPGVSGATIAVILKLFDDLIYSINNIFKQPKKSILFLTPLLLGAVVGILVFSSFISYGLENHSFMTTMFFVGLVVGSGPYILRKSTEKGYKNYHFIYAIISFAIIVIMTNANTSESTGLVVENFTITQYLYLFLGGALASGAMIIPGISGSFIMILIGMYPLLIYGLDCIKEYLLNPSDIQLLIYILQLFIPMGLGILTGIIVISKLIEALFKKAYTETYFCILGLVLGSVYALLSEPLTYQSGFNTIIFISGLITLAVGIFIAILLEKKS